MEEKQTRFVDIQAYLQKKLVANAVPESTKMSKKNLLGLQDDIGEIENVHRTGKKQDGKPRQIIAKLYSRPFKREFLRVAKRPENKEALNGI